MAVNRTTIRQGTPQRVTDPNVRAFLNIVARLLVEDLLAEQGERSEQAENTSFLKRNSC